MNKEKPKVFISYSWDDKAISRKLADCLRRDGAQVWIDYSENKAGDSFIRKMNEGLEWCDTFVLLWSESAENSNFVSMEWEGALAINLKIIPCLLDKTKLPVILSGRIYKDLSDFDEGYSSLAKDLDLVIEEEKRKEVKKVIKTSQKKIVRKQESIKPIHAIFRSSPYALSIDDVESMLKKWGFFDSEYNKSGRGFHHQYEQKTINDDKIIIDRTSGLIWQQSGSSKYMQFEGANKYIVELIAKRFAGFKDWRLPTLEEAMGLMEPEEKNNSYINPIFDRKQDWIWTADKVAGESQAWVVIFNYGHWHRGFLDYGYYVRAVCFGQSSQE